MRFTRFIKRYWFHTGALTLGFILVANLTGGFTRLDLFMKGLKDHSVVTDVEQWQSWLNRNSDFFEPLAQGAKVGVTQDLESAYGVIWTKTAAGFSVERTNRLQKDGPGIILVFDDQVATELRAKKNPDEAISFLRNRSQAGKVQAYYIKNADKLGEEGFLTFLQSIGLRPS